MCMRPYSSSSQRFIESPGQQVTSRVAGVVVPGAGPIDTALKRAFATDRALFRFLFCPVNRYFFQAIAQACIPTF